MGVVTFLEDIVSGASGETANSSLLRQLRVLASRTGGAPLDLWVSAEFNGYGPDDAVPADRGPFRPAAFGHFVGSFGAQRLRRCAQKPIAEFKEMAKSTASTLGWPADMVQVYNPPQRAGDRCALHRLLPGAEMDRVPPPRDGAGSAPTSADPDRAAAANRRRAARRQCQVTLGAAARARRWGQRLTVPPSSVHADQDLATVVQTGMYGTSPRHRGGWLAVSAPPLGDTPCSAGHHGTALAVIGACLLTTRALSGRWTWAVLSPGRR